MTLSQLAGVDISNFLSAADLVRHVQTFNMSDPLKQLILATMQVPRKQMVQSALDTLLHHVGLIVSVSDNRVDECDAQVSVKNIHHSLQ